MKPLVVMALEVEEQGLLSAAGIPVLFTGVGKVNATYALTRALTEYRCGGRPLPHVVNFGTAGSRVLSTGSLVACTSFVQRDMDVTGLGFAVTVTPFDDVPATLSFPHTLPDLPALTCHTADSFETDAIARDTAVVDMEAYALAKVCRKEDTPFTCIKYITDGANADAAQDWNANLKKAAVAFLQIYQSLFP